MYMGAVMLWQTWHHLELLLIAFQAPLEEHLYLMSQVTLQEESKKRKTNLSLAMMNMTTTTNE